MKKITATILVLAMLLSIGALGASAAQIGDTVDWDYTGEHKVYYVHNLNGYLELGENTILPVSTNEDDNIFDVVYEFEVEEAGCYLIDHRDTEGLEIAEIYENGYACGFEEGSLPDDDGELIYWLDEGTALFGINVKEEGSTVSIKSYDGERPSLTYDADYYIESVEIENFEYYKTAYERFNGTYSFVNPLENGAKITVNFKNGTSAEVETYQVDNGMYSSIQVPVGDGGYYFYPVCAYKYTDKETSKIYFVLTIDECEMIKEEFTIIKKDFATNFEQLKKSLTSTSWVIESKTDEIFTMLKNGDFEVFADNIGEYISDITWWIELSISYITEFAIYLIK